MGRPAASHDSVYVWAVEGNATKMRYHRMECCRLAVEAPIPRYLPG
jgi:hypothetical protein